MTLKRPGITTALTLSVMAMGTAALFGTTHALGQQPGDQGLQTGNAANGPASGAVARVGQPPARLHYTLGTVSAVDAAAHTVSINGQQGGVARVIKVNPDATIEAQETIQSGNLRVGDEVEVQGIPTGISASQITAGTPPQFLPTSRIRRTLPSANSPAGQVDANGNTAPPGPPPGNAMAEGKVVSTMPLTISLGESMDVVLKIARDAKITRYQTVQFSRIHVGDTVIAAGQTTADGGFTASGIGINFSFGTPAARSIPPPSHRPLG